MESSIAAFLPRQLACELLPTFTVGTNARAAPPGCVRPANLRASAWSQQRLRHQREPHRPRRQLAATTSTLNDQRELVHGAVKVVIADILRAVKATVNLPG